jgi:methylated-DNA-[protein]-cysteine S-methyltransferase
MTRPRNNRQMTNRGAAFRTCCTHLTSPIGRLLLLADEAGLRRIIFEETEAILWAGLERDPLKAPFRETVLQLESYFEGTLKQFNLPLAPEGTAFQLQVWRKLIEIPYGSTITYSDLADALGKPGAARAVGSANGRNPLPIIVPCHRVIGGDGSLTGYGGGLRIKAFLLNLERTAR